MCPALDCGHHLSRGSDSSGRRDAAPQIGYSDPAHSPAFRWLPLYSAGVGGLPLSSSPGRLGFQSLADHCGHAGPLPLRAGLSAQASIVHLPRALFDRLVDTLAFAA